MRFTDFLCYELFKATDSVMRDVEINLTKNTAKIEFSAEGGDDWINIEIQMKDVVEYQIKSDCPHILDVMSGGIEYDIFDGIHYFNFDIYSSEGDGVERYRSSAFYLACKDFTYITKEYSEYK